MAFSPATPEALDALSTEQGGLKVPSHLTPKERTSPASRWTLRHLIAYRLLVKPETSFLVTFRSEHDAQCPACNAPRDDMPQVVDDRATAALTQLPNPTNLSIATEAELMQVPHGSFWLALARAIQPEDAEPRQFPQRVREDVKRSSFVDSSTAIVGSSSPTRPSSSSDFEMSTGSVDEDEYDARRGKPEEVTVHLAISFLQQALCTYLIQDSGGLIEVRARVERQRSHAACGVGHIIAEDDGGICRMERLPLGWAMTHPYVALLEAKRAFRHTQVSTTTGETRPIVSNEVVAQCFGEAVATWVANRDSIGQESGYPVPQPSPSTVVPLLIAVRYAASSSLQHQIRSCDSCISISGHTTANLSSLPTCQPRKRSLQIRERIPACTCDARSGSICNQLRDERSRFAISWRFCDGMVTLRVSRMRRRGIGRAAVTAIWTRLCCATRCVKE